MLLKNGLIATEQGAISGDIRIVGETITEIGLALEPAAGEEVVDASGKIILPGGVDAHTHMDLDLGTVRATDDFYTGTVAAACGGTTTIIDHMAFGPPGCSIRHQVDAYHKLAGGKAVIDYGFHGVMDHVDDAILQELGALAQEGITSHKVYLTYGGKITDGAALRLLERTAELGVLLTVHPENDGAVNYLRQKLKAAGETAPIAHARSRPPECEAEAIGRMILFAQMAGDAPLYIVHLSNALGLSFIRAARARGQRHLFAETCPQYLLLDESRYLEPDGLKYIMSPPLRSAEHLDALWQGIHDGAIDTVATDHCPFFYHGEKQRGKDDFTLAPGGAPGVETRLPLLFSEIAAGRLTLGRLVSLCCATPARLFGLYPKKGVVAVGSDADLVLVDPAKTVRLTRDMLHENTDYTPYEGMELSGYPVMTIARGEVIVRDNQFVGRRGRGKFLRRGLPDLTVRR